MLTTCVVTSACDRFSWHDLYALMRLRTRRRCAQSGCWRGAEWCEPLTIGAGTLLAEASQPLECAITG